MDFIEWLLDEEESWMRKVSKAAILLVIGVVVFCMGQSGCPGQERKPTKSATGVRKATARVKVQASGLTLEQDNVKKRIELENDPGAIKHLYVISAMSGQAIIYSTVKGKVTSSGKRLTPYEVAATDGQYVDSDMKGIPVNIGGRKLRTSEVLQDDGTYGHSIHYLFWWDVQGRYHQHYVSGGQIIHISDKPIAMKNIIVNMELAENKSL